MLISLEEVAHHLRIDSDAATDDEADLTLKIQAASSAIRTYLDGASPYVKDVEGKDTEEVLPVVKMATLQLVGELYKNREGEMSGRVGGQYGYGYLPQGVIALLYPLRKPSMA